MAHRLWEKGEAVDEVVFDFTVGSDPSIDLELIEFDCLGSAAHATMLQSIGVLTEVESSKIVGALSNLYSKARRGEVKIPPELEDCHTTIEAQLTEALGETGERVHTGRSRNDQVLLCMRLLLRDRCVSLLQGIFPVLDAFEMAWVKFSNFPLPGYTHLMPAMPASVGMWLHGHYEALLEVLRDGLSLLGLLNSNPLGAASGFDVPLPLDRALVAKLLQFDRVQRSVVDVQNSRGRYERRVMSFCAEFGAVVEKIAWDLQLFFMKEFGFISLPANLTTGSSIMPQKRNPDVLELLRGTVGRIRGALEEVSWVAGKLPSNYHRDYQLTKEPTLRGLSATRQMIQVLPIVIRGVTFSETALRKALHPDLFATYGVYARVRKGMPFRQAYREVAERIKGGHDEATPYQGDFLSIAQRVEEGWKDGVAERAELGTQVAGWRKRLEAIPESFGFVASGPREKIVN